MEELDSGSYFLYRSFSLSTHFILFAAMQLPGICSGRKSDQYNSVEGEAYFTDKGRPTMFDLGLTVTDKVSTYLLQRHERGQHHLLLDFLDELQGDLETVHLSYLRSYDEIVRLFAMKRSH